MKYTESRKEHLQHEIENELRKTGKSIKAMKEAKLGMYGESPRIQVGKYSICRQDDDHVWIECESGEGAEFPDGLFEKVLDIFYKEFF